MSSIKLYDLLKTTLNELGENTAEPYTATSREVKELGYNRILSIHYTWETENNVNYTMKIIRRFDNYMDQTNYKCRYEIIFGIVEPDSEYYDTQITSKSGKVGNMRRIMATVIKYTKEEIARDTKDGYKIIQVTMSPTKETNFDDRRTNLYLAYIKKNMPPGATVDYSSNSNEIRINL